MATLAQLDTVFDSNVAGLVRGLLLAQKQVAATDAQVKSSAKEINAAITTLGAAAGAAAVGAAVGLALPFEDAFTKIDASSNASAKDIADWRNEVLTLSGETAQAPTELANALFFLASAGLKAGQPMEVLEASAKASAVGLGETADVARLTANVLNAYADSGITAAQVTDTLVAAVREGTADTDEFSGAIGRILPIASRAGVGFDQIAASLAALSNIGLDVNEGVTAMRGLLQSLVAPTDKSRDALAALNLSADQLRSVLAEGGLPAALQLLEERSGGNIDILQQLVPNIRALTGELGLTGENAEQVAAIFERVRNSLGSTEEAFATTAEGPAFQFRQALNEITVIGTEFGQKVLPAVVDAVKSVAPVLRVAAQNAKALLTVFLAYKGLRAVPAILDSIALGLNARGFKSAAFSTASLATSFGVLGQVAGPAALAIGAMVAANQSLRASNEQARASTAAFLEDLNAKLAEGGDIADQAHAKWEELFGSMPDWAIQTLGLGTSVESARHHFNDSAEAIRRHSQAEQLMALQTAKLTPAMEDASRAAATLGFRTRESFKEFAKSVAESVQVSVGQFRRMNEAFKTTPTQLRNQLNAALGVARTYQRDVATILGDDSLSKAQKRALLKLSPEQRHAFVEAGRAAREQLAEDALKLERINRTAMKTVTAAAKDPARRGGQQTGSELISGAIAGVNEHTGLLAAAFAREVAAAIQAGRDAADAQSPSRETQKLGADMVEGLILGITRGVPVLDRVLERVIGKIRDHMSELSDVEDDARRAALRAADLAAIEQLKGFGKELDRLTKRWDKLREKVDAFKDAIRSGFDQFDIIGGAVDLLEKFNQEMADFLEAQANGTLEPGQVAPTAPDLGAFAASQAAQAQQLADVLTQLSAAGLNTDMLGQLAAQGPAGIALGQELLNNPALIEAFNQAQAQIAAALGQTTNQLVSDQFGAQLADLGADFEALTKAARKFLSGVDEDIVPRIGQIVKALNKILEDLGITPSGGGGGGGRPNSPPFVPFNPRGASLAGGDHPHEIRVLVDGQQMAAVVDEGLARRRGDNGRLALDPRP